MTNSIIIPGADELATLSTILRYCADRSIDTIVIPEAVSGFLKSNPGLTLSGTGKDPTLMVYLCDDFEIPTRPEDHLSAPEAAFLTQKYYCEPHNIEKSLLHIGAMMQVENPKPTAPVTSYIIDVQTLLLPSTCKTSSIKRVLLEDGSIFESLGNKEPREVHKEVLRRKKQNTHEIYSSQYVFWVNNKLIRLDLFNFNEEKGILTIEAPDNDKELSTSLQDNIFENLSIKCIRNIENIIEYLKKLCSTMYLV